MANLQFCAAYLTMDVFCVVLALIVLHGARGDTGSETQVRYFKLLLGAYLAFVISDGIWAFIMFSGLLTVQPIMPAIFNGANKVAVAFAGYFWFCYSLARFDSPLVYNRTARWIAAIPVALVPILYIFGFVTGQNVIVNAQDGTTTNGVVYLAITGISLLYLLAATGAAIANLRHATSTSERKTCFVFIAFMAAPAAAGIFDGFVPNMPVMAPAMLISILLVLLSLQESRISSDALTNLNNRRRADMYLEDSLQRVSDEQPLYLFIVDMDHFKSINDTYGHLEGDHALQLMAEALRQACSSLNAFAARWGGDEFVVICTHGVGDDPARVVGIIKARLRDLAEQASVPYPLGCSVGYAECRNPDQNRAELISAADRTLYAAKRAL